MKTKPCNLCGEIKSLLHFNKKCDTYDGHTSRCKACFAKIRKEVYLVKKDHLIEKNKKWYEKNKESYNAKRRENFDSERNKIARKKYYEENKDKVRKINKEWEANNVEKMREVWRNYASRNSDNRARISANRRAAKVNATILKDDEFNKFAMKEIYNLRMLRTNLTRISWDVDHIVPIKNEDVCGLHVWYNLQVIPSQINRSKSNKF